MRKLIIMVALAALAVAAHAWDRNTAVGRGGFTLDQGGAASVQFSIDQQTRTAGSLLFAADGGEHRYPDIIIRVPNIEVAFFSRNFVTFGGSGDFQGLPVYVKAFAYDGGLGPKMDRFDIFCFDSSGQLVYHSNGALSIGDITIGHQ